jgi:hypothetical protein
MQTPHNQIYEWGRIFSHFLYPIVGIAAGGVGIAMRKWQENAGANWPVVEGRVQYVNVRAGEGRDHLSHAAITYSYFINQYESGEYVRTFLREQSAWDFTNALKDKKVQVHYNPRKPADSTLLKDELERLLPIRSENTFTH